MALPSTADHPQRLICIRQRTDGSSGPRRPVGEAARAARHDLHESAGAALEDIGLEEVRAIDSAPSTSTSEIGRFRSLPGLDAVIVDSFAGTSVDDVRASLGDEYLVMPDVDLELPDAAAQADDAQPIAADAVRPLDAVLPDATGIPDAHAAGNRGEGAVIAVFDTGVDADHAEFAGQVIDFGYAPPGGGQVRADRRGFDTASHGTHVCGTLTGKTVGIAPEADLLVVSVIESERLVTSASRVIEALYWLQRRCGDPRYEDKPVVLSMSLGFRPESLSAADMQTTMEALRLLMSELLRRDGILPLVAIGNDGAGVVRAPGYYPEALSVGAVDYDRASWAKSGGGPAPGDTRICPDIAGFGVGVVSATGRDPQGASWYGEKSGTSMATPYVAGVAALTAAKTGLEGMALRQQLLDNATPAPGLGPERVGKGIASYA